MTLKGILKDKHWRFFNSGRLRINQIGFIPFIKEMMRYYKRYSKMPKIFNGKPGIKYKAFVLYNYFKVCYMFFDKDHQFIMDYFPTRLQIYFLKNANPRELKYKTFNKLFFYRILEENKIPYPEVYIFKEGGRLFDLQEKQIDENNIPFGVEVFAKPFSINGGEGAEVLKLLRDTNFKEGYLYQKRVYNHSILREFSKVDTFNTVRTMSYLDKQGQVHLLNSIIRISKGRIVDNWGKGSINIDVDIETGRMGKNGVTKYNERYETHPVSKIKFEGFQIPYWEEYKELVRRLSYLFNDLRFIAWDIGIGENGPIVIEGNAGCDFFHAQLFKPYYNNIVITDNIEAELKTLK